MRSILIILFTVLSLNSILAQQHEPNENKSRTLSFKQNEVFKRFGVFASANVLYYHSNYGIGFDCFLVKNFSANIEIAVGESFGQEEPIYIQEIGSSVNIKYINSKASIGLKYWPITKKTNNTIYPYFGVNLAFTSVEFNTLVEDDLWDMSLLSSTIIETPLGLCYYKDGFQLAFHVGAFMDLYQDFSPLIPRKIYPFISFQVGFRF
jgi:hypothetical protein